VSVLFLNKYLKTFVLGKSELPLHYQLSIDSYLREFPLSGVEKLLKYLSTVLGCVVFYIEEGGRLISKGLSNLIDDIIIGNCGDLKLLLSLLDDDDELKKVIDKNFTLYPILVTNQLEINGKSVESVVFISANLKLYREDGSFRLAKFGFIGPLSMNLDLAVPILQYLKDRSAV